MKKAFIVTSIIDVNPNIPLTYSKIRSCFSSEERFRQTLYTINCLNLISDTDTVIYLLDASENWQHYSQFFSYQSNLKYISVKKEFPEIYNDVTTHQNKSHCECQMLSTFVRAYKDELSQYDYTFKLSGRYFFDRSFDLSVCNEENLGKIFYKRPLSFEWNDGWGYEMVDLRKDQGDNCLRQYCSVLYGWGREYNSKMYDIFTGVSTMLTRSQMQHYDIETLGYYMTRPFEKDIIETDWTVYGWHGCSGTFIRY